MLKLLEALAGYPTLVDQQFGRVAVEEFAGELRLEEGMTSTFQRWAWADDAADGEGPDMASDFSGFLCNAEEALVEKRLFGPAPKCHLSQFGWPLGTNDTYWSRFMPPGD
jgi:hypothetical protein